MEDELHKRAIKKFQRRKVIIKFLYIILVRLKCAKELYIKIIQ